MRFSEPIVLWDGKIRPQGDVTYVVRAPLRIRRGLLRNLCVVVAVALLLVTGGAQVIRTDGPARSTTVSARVGAPVSGGGVADAVAPEAPRPVHAAAAPVVKAPAMTTPSAKAPVLVAPAPGLTAPLARSLAKAEQAAAAAGIHLSVTSGYRTRAEQQRLFDAAVRQYGSAAVARRWVLPPAESAHVQGRAVDIGPRAGARWLEVNGVRWGLCRRYVNEWWHFERLAPAVGQKCPALEPDAAG